jgi:hypothetical protein
MADATQIYQVHPNPEEITDVLGKRLTATVGTLNEDGSVHLGYVALRAETQKEISGSYDDVWLPNED